jgi:peptidoglycan/LPS O-acetylase OafA/YrhL/lysophospholipase L1-like esterase
VQFAQILRGPAALLVLASHLFAAFWHSQETVSRFIFADPLALDGAALKGAGLLSANSLFLGQLGVGVFFLISGFVIPFSLQRHSRMQFVLLRCLRIYPVYVIGLAISLLAIHLIADRPVTLSPADIVRQSLILPRLWWSSPAVDPIVWTLEIELHFYLLLAILRPYVLTHRMPALWLAGMTLIIAGTALYSGLVRHAAYLSYGRALAIMAFMLIGTAFHFHFAGKIGHKHLTLFSLVMLTGLGAAFGFSVINRTPFFLGAVWLQFLSAYGTALIVFSFCYCKREFIDRFARSKLSSPLRLAANISYPLYAIHAIVGYSLLHFLVEWSALPWYSLVLTLSVVFSAAWLLHVFVERPALAFGKTCRAFWLRRRPVLNNKTSLFHVVLSSDSLSFPRPWNQRDIDAHPEQFFRFDTTYPYLLKNQLQDWHSDRDVVVSNLGRRAVTVSNLKNISYDLLSWMQADAVIIHHGIVDSWIRNVETGETRTSEEDFESVLANFMEMKREIAPGLPVIVIEIAHTNDRMLQKVPKQNEVIDEFNKILHKFESSEQCVEVLDYSTVPENMTLVHEDGHHLSLQGHVYLAEQLAQRIKLMD